MKIKLEKKWLILIMAIVIILQFIILYSSKKVILSYYENSTSVYISLLENINFTQYIEALEKIKDSKNDISESIETKPTIYELNADFIRNLRLLNVMYPLEKQPKKVYQSVIYDFKYRYTYFTKGQFNFDRELFAIQAELHEFLINVTNKGLTPEDKKVIDGLISEIRKINDRIMIIKGQLKYTDKLRLRGEFLVVRRSVANISDIIKEYKHK